jgi:hypothetical protein
MSISREKSKIFIDMDDEVVLTNKKQEMLVSTEEKKPSYSVILGIVENGGFPVEENKEFLTNVCKSLYAALFNAEVINKRTEASVSFDKFETSPKDFDFHIALIGENYTLWKVVPWTEVEEDNKKSFSYLSVALFSKDKEVMDRAKENLPKYNKMILGFLNALATSVYDKYTGDVSIIIETGIPENKVQV